MGCASSTPAQVNIPSNTKPNASHQPTKAYVQRAPKPPAIGSEKVKKKKRKSSSSSSSSSESETEDLATQRQKIKAASQAAVELLEKKQEKDKQSEEVKKTLISDDAITKYMTLSHSIAALERKNILQRLHEKYRLSISVKKSATALNDEYRNLQMKTEKEYEDVKNLINLKEGGNVEHYFESQVTFDSQMSKEQEEYLQAKAEMEDCYKKIEALAAQEGKIDKEIQDLKLQNQELLDFYKQQDQLLETLFGDSYGSELEDLLEGQLDNMLEKQQYVEQAMQKWKNAQAIVRNAHQQLDYAYGRWVQVMNIPMMQNTQLTRVRVTAEVRSYLAAASQNLTNAHTLIHPAQAPYCNRQEIQTLNHATACIFFDAMNRERLGHAAQVYITTRNRCGMFLQWIDNVLVRRISVDFQSAQSESLRLRKELRTERARLLEQRVELESGRKLNIEEFKDVDSGIESDVEADDALVAVDSSFSDTKELDKQISEAEKEGEVDGEKTVKDEEKPIPLDQLAPQPTANELFGDLDSIMADYNGQKEELSKTAATQEARQKMKLKEKLQRRRSRKDRLLNNQADLDKLIEEDNGHQSVVTPVEA